MRAAHHLGPDGPLPWLLSILAPERESRMTTRRLQVSSLLLLAAAFICSSCASPGPSGPERIVAIGDLHGDLEAARAALRLAGAIDADDRWIGKRLVVVQTGDILDRGDGEESIMALFQRLQREAPSTGGRVWVLNGNHELMNASLDFRYVTEGGFRDFQDAGVVPPPDSLLESLPAEERARAAAFRPGGPFALQLAERPTALIVGSSVFVHGGILPEHVAMGLDSMNRDVQRWLRGEIPRPEWIQGDRSPVWTRLYSNQPGQAACDTLSAVLDDLGVQRMVVGHTVQGTGITAFCGGRVWCIDVGQAAYYKGQPEVLEIRGDVVRSLR
jgi:hypothetical protein